MKTEMRTRLFLVVRAALALLAGTLGAQAAQSASFACLPKAEREKAEKLLIAARASGEKTARSFRAELDPLVSDAQALRRMVDERRYRGLPSAAGEKGEGRDADFLPRLKKAESAFLAKYSQAALTAAPPAEAIALAKLLRSKALKTDPAAIEKAERAIEASFPRQSADLLKELGAKFKAGGAAAYLAYVACLCESWLLDPEPFARLEGAEAKSLNDSQGVRHVLRQIGASLSAQKKYLARPLYYAYPPIFFSDQRNEADKDAAASFEAFLDLQRSEFGDQAGTRIFIDERLRVAMLDYLDFFALLPDAAFRRLAHRFGRDAASPLADSARPPEASGSQDAAAALGTIEDFESALGSGKPETAALALMQDATACAILNGIQRYAEQKKDFLDFSEVRILKIAAQAYPGRQARVSSCLDDAAFNAVLELKEANGEWSLPVGELEILRKLKPDSISQVDRLILARLLPCARIIAVSPLEVLAAGDEAAFSWRFRLFGGSR